MQNTKCKIHNLFARLSQVENALKGQKHIAQGSALGIDTDRNYALLPMILSKHI